MSTPERPDASRPPGTGANEMPEAMLDAALQRFYGAAPGQRDAVLDELCAASPHHAATLRTILSRITAAERTLARAFPEANDQPTVIGDLPVIRKLGEGAFGDVWLCEQTVPVARPVAVKVLRPGMGDRHTLARFAAERQLLANLHHATITHVYDAGRLPDGRPFIVMEYVDGRPITLWCRDHQGPVEERLRLFVELCHGVAHAHGHGVVHRDLKPGNVLVVDDGGRPRPKVIDFGIAKALSRAGVTTADDLEPPATDAGRVLGTPGYMSPEQAEGRAAAVDARADVFGLGVLLHEMLTGELPWPRDHFAGQETPPLASDRLTARSQHAAAPAAPELQRLATRVRGDLDWIVRKATSYHRDDRYPSAQALAADIDNHLAGRPVTAGPPTWRYRSGKFLRRHRAAAWTAALTGAAALLLSVVAFERTRAAEANFAVARDAIEQLRRRAMDIVREQPGANESVRQALAADALTFYDTWLQQRPSDVALRLGRAEALITLSEVHWAIGQGGAALRAAVEAFDEASAIGEGDGAGADPRRVRSALGDATRHRARALRLLRRFDEAETWHPRAIALLQLCHADDPERHGLALSAALREQGATAIDREQIDAAEAAFRRSIDVLNDLIARGLDRDAAGRDLVSAQLALAMAQVQGGRRTEADATLTTAAAGLPQLGADRWRPAAALQLQRARLCAAGEDLEATREHYRLAVEAGEQWCQHEPRQVRARELLRAALAELAAAHASATDWAAADTAIARAMVVAEQTLAEASEPELPREDLRRMAYEFGRALLDRFRRRDLPAAEALVARAVQLGGQMPKPRAPLPWQIEALRLQLMAADGRDDAAAWERLATLLPGEPTDATEAATCVEAWLGITRTRLQRGDHAATGVALTAAAAITAAHGDRIAVPFHARLAYWQARHRLALGDLDAAAEPITRLRQLRPNWWGETRTGECLLLAAALARTAGDPTAATGYEQQASVALQRAIDQLQPTVEQQPEDPWYVVPWGFAQLRLAELSAARGDAEAARARLDLALPALARIAADAHVDQWDPAHHAAAMQLHERPR